LEFVSDNELGVFLRSRRDTLAPAEVGLAAGARRRAPGLRRTELATLAGISVEYLTRLEQGRDRHPSVQVLGALADALRLSTDERIHLRRLAKAAGGGPGLCPAMAAAREVRPTMRALLDRLEPTPAYLLNRLGDILAHTTGFAALAGPLGILDAAEPNFLYYFFTDPRARRAYPDWDRIADELVGQLKIESTVDDPHIGELTDELTVAAGARFTDRWTTGTTLPTRTGIDRIAHPTAGELRLAYETLDLPDLQRLIVYLPADDPTATALATLTHPGPLRAIN
jgi:transcriptional regulator with XRE-family HTH domain